MQRTVAKRLATAVGNSAATTGIRTLATSAKYPAYVVNAPATEVTTLPNGVRVASEGGHGDTATVGVFIDAGSRYESEANNGVAHFLEHMFFKGTAKRNRRALEVEIENMGGHLNAYTSREQTVYLSNVFKNDVPKAMDILGDILNASKFDASAIDAERNVILREMEEVNANPESLVFDLLHETAYQKSGLGRTILGPTERIQSLTRDDLVNFIKTHYTGPRVVVAGAGNVNHKQLVELAQAQFGNLPATSPNPAAVVTTTPEFIGSDLRWRDDSNSLAHIALAFEAGSWTSPYAFPLMVIHTLLGSWDRTSGNAGNVASRLGQLVASKNLAHSYKAFNTCYKDTGLLGIYAVAEPTTLNDLMYWTMHTLVSLCHHTTEEDVARARTQLKSALLSHLDGSASTCDEIGRQVLVYGRRLTPAELFARIDDVDAAAVRATADLFINDKDVAVAAFGSIHELPDYNWLRRRTYWLNA